MDAPETRKKDVVTVRNFAEKDLKGLERVVSKIGLIMKLELNLRGIPEPKIGLFHTVNQGDIEAQRVEFIVDVDRQWNNQQWHEYVVKLDQILKMRIHSAQLDAFRMTF